MCYPKYPTHPSANTWTDLATNTSDVDASRSIVEVTWYVDWRFPKFPPLFVASVWHFWHHLSWMAIVATLQGFLRSLNERRYLPKDMWVVFVNIKSLLALQLLPEPGPKLLKLYQTSCFSHQLMACPCDFHLIFCGFIRLFKSLVLWPMGCVGMSLLPGGPLRQSLIQGIWFCREGIVAQLTPSIAVGESWKKNTSTSTDDVCKTKVFGHPKNWDHGSDSFSCDSEDLLNKFFGSHLAMRYEIALVTAAYFRELLGKKQGVLYEDHQAGDCHMVKGGSPK